MNGLKIIKTKIQNILLITLVVLLATAGFSSSQVSASELHHGHTDVALCAALCETPPRRQEVTTRAASDSNTKQETEDTQWWNERFIYETEPNDTAMRTFRPRVDKLSSLKRISVYRF